MWIMLAIEMALRKDISLDIMQSFLELMLMLNFTALDCEQGMDISGKKL